MPGHCDFHFVVLELDDGDIEPKSYWIELEPLLDGYHAQNRPRFPSITKPFHIFGPSCNRSQTSTERSHQTERFYQGIRASKYRLLFFQNENIKDNLKLIITSL